MHCLSKKDALTSPLVYSNRGKFVHIVVSSYPLILDVPNIKPNVIIVRRSTRFHVAMAHLKLKSWAQAEDNATSALQIDRLHSKSYQRRCVARLSLGKVREAMVDVCAAEDCCVLSKKEKHGVDNCAAISSTLAEIQKLRVKVEKALVDTAKRAPRRKLPITIVTS